MEALVAALVILAAVVVYALVRRSRAAKARESGQSLIRFCIPLSENTYLDPACLMADFYERWGIKIGCEENADWSNPTQKMRKYLLTDGLNMIIISTYEKPLPPNLRKITAESAPDLTNEQRTAFMEHHGFAAIEYATGPDEPVENVRFTARVLLSMLSAMPGTGYISIPGQVYRPVEKVRQFMREGSVDLPVLFVLAVGLQYVYDQREVWLHTHGMEQFRLPDLEMKFPDKAAARRHQELISNTAVYMMDEGPVMKPGHTCELGDDGIVYQVRAPRGESKKHFGRYSALEIVRKA